MAGDVTTAMASQSRPRMTRLPALAPLAPRGAEPIGEATKHYGRLVGTAEPAELARHTRAGASGRTHPLPALAAATTLVGIIAMSAVAAPAGATDQQQSSALVRDGGTVYVVGTGSDVRHRVEVDPASTIAHPAPGLVSFVGSEQIELLHLISGDVSTVANPAGPLTGSWADGLRLAPSTVNQGGDGDAGLARLGGATGSDAASAQPGPPVLTGLLDIVTGAVVTIDDLGEPEPPEVVGQADQALLILGADGLAVVPLSTEFDGVIELPEVDPDEVVLADDGRRVGAVDDGHLVAAVDGGELAVVADDVGELLGAVPGGWMVRTSLGDLAVIADDGSVFPVASSAIPSSTDAEVVGDAGLVAVPSTGEPEAWYRVESGGQVTAIERAAGLTFVAGDGDGWWFATGDSSAPFEGSPLIGVNPADGRVVEVEANLAMLAALSTEGVISPDGRYLYASFLESGGFQGLALADAHTGVVLNLDNLEPPLRFAPDDRHILSPTVQGPTVTTLGDGQTLISPIFDIDADDPAALEYRWVTS